MAKERMINTRIWNDNWFSQLDPIEKLLFLYFLSNSYTNISGVYEMPLKIAAVETGIDPSMLDKILPRLHPKIVWYEGWVVIPKFTKHQNTRSSDVVKGILREFDSAPEKVRKLAIDAGWGEGLGTVGGPSGDTKPNLTKPNLTIREDESSPVEMTYEYENTSKKKEDLRRVKDKETIFTLFGAKRQPWWIHRQQREAALRLFDMVGVEKVRNGLSVMREHAEDKFCPQAYTPFEYEEKRSKLAGYMKRNDL